MVLFVSNYVPYPWHSLLIEMSDEKSSVLAFLWTFPLWWGHRQKNKPTPKTTVVCGSKCFIGSGNLEIRRQSLNKSRQRRQQRYPLTAPSTLRWWEVWRKHVDNERKVCRWLLLVWEDTVRSFSRGPVRQRWEPRASISDPSQHLFRHFTLRPLSSLWDEAFSFSKTWSVFPRPSILCQCQGANSEIP